MPDPTWGPIPECLTEEQLGRLNAEDLNAIRHRYNHPYVCTHPEAKAVVNAIVGRLYAIQQMLGTDNVGGLFLWPRCKHMAPAVLVDGVGGCQVCTTIEVATKAKDEAETDAAERLQRMLWAEGELAIARNERDEARAAIRRIKEDLAILRSDHRYWKHMAESLLKARPFLRDASSALEETLVRNDDKPCWMEEWDKELLLKLKEERDEVDVEIQRYFADEPNRKELLAELLDEAAVCLMLWARYGGSDTQNRGREVMG